tara:strand:+ start:242 stop:526 length:285 start_codon:yes stop_codon:yes gene_type:complete
MRILFKDYNQARNYTLGKGHYYGCECGCGSGGSVSYEIRGNWVYEKHIDIDLDLYVEEQEFIIGFIWVNNNPKSKQSKDNIVIPKGIMNYRPAS